ncbi:MAG TPA: DUF4920 domain-containing protein [Chitinophagaceae bacterium]|nr:DUF4920 domain-containing protein [Chitinophagaceae bacterium]
MKKYILSLLSLVWIVTSFSQETPSAQKGTHYGKPFTPDNSISITDLEANLKDQKYSGKITGKVVEVCQVKGCWIKLDRGNGETVLAKTNDAFFMPKDIVGKTVMIEADASVKERTVKELRHYAEDAGKSKEEIKKIKKPKKELTLALKGVQVL